MEYTTPLSSRDLRSNRRTFLTGGNLLMLIFIKLYTLLYQYFTYILTNKNKTTLYTGVTNNLSRRLEEHNNDALANKRSFTGRYKCIHLLYFEEYQNIYHAIAREKEIKGWSREKKIALIKTTNPELAFLNNDDSII